jgi:hypothetical protein
MRTSLIDEAVLGVGAGQWGKKTLLLPQRI